MKTIRNLLLIPLVLGYQCFAAEPDVPYGPTAASDLLEEVCKKAESESKLIFLKSGFPECGWCVVFDRYHKRPEAKQILEKYYVIAAIDTRYMPDGREVFSALAEPGSPSWVIISPDKKVIVDSYNEGQNMGYPLEPNETEYYQKALKMATPAITEAELKVLSEQIKKAAGR